MRIAVFFLILFTSHCDVKFSRKAGQYSSLLGLMIASQSAAAKFVSADFISSSTLAPVVIAKTRKLGFTMDSEMSTDCELTFDGTAMTSTVSLSSDKKTIYFSPGSLGWPVKLDTVTYINSGACKDANGNSLTSTGTGVPVFIADTVTYLSSTGNDGSAGTAESPLLSFTKAVQTAYSTCPGACAIAVNGGTYSSSASIAMPPNISIFGGFDPSDWKKRRADKSMLSPYDTVIEDSAVNAVGSASAPYGTIRFDNFTGVKEKSIIDGIIIKGASTGTASSFGAPVSFSNVSAGSGFSVRNSILLDRSSSASFSSAGLMGSNNAGNILVYNSYVSASTDTASATTSKYGIYYNGSSSGSDLSVALSEIVGGSASLNSAGFYPGGPINGKITLYQNTIRSGNNSGGDSIGVGVSFSGSDGFVVSENTISTGTGINSFGIYNTTGNGAVFYKNKITAGNGTSFSTGIEVNGPASSQISDNEIISVGAGGTLHGIRIITGTPILSNNKVSFGLWNGSSVKGIRLNTGGTAVGNTVTLAGCASGACNSTIGLDIGGTTTASSNIISSGDCPNAGCNSYGIKTNGGGGGPMTLSANTISSGTSVTQSMGVQFAFNHGFTMTDSTVSGGACTASACANAGFNITGSTSGVTLSGNTISVAPCTGAPCTQEAVSILSAGTVDVSGNTLNGGNTVSVGATAKALTTSAGGTFKRNTFSAGSGNGNFRTLELASTVNQIKLCSNVIIGGQGTAAGSPVSLYVGAASSAVVKFYGNTIIGGKSASPISAIALASAGTFNFDFKYNLISGSTGYSAGTNCFDEYASVDFSALDSNNVSQCSTYYLNQPGPAGKTQICGGNFTAAACGSPLANPPGVNNTDLIPVFVNESSNDFHLGSGTPAGITTVMGAPAVTSYNGTCGDSLDRDGNTRTASSALGAYR